MAIIVFAETSENQLKKSAFEAVGFASGMATDAGPVIAVCIGPVSNAEALGNSGANEIVTVEYNGEFQAENYAEILAQICKNNNAETAVISNSYSGKSIAGRLAVKLGASLVTNVISMPDTSNGFRIRRSVFSGKAFGWVKVENSKKVLAITPNSFEIPNTGNTASISSFQADLSQVPNHSKIVSVNKVSGKIPLTEAEIVISGGRGMKGPENWGMLEELADVLGGATACSKPVSDMHWRPHSEHVGQTGITIKPNLYIAVGISGAIQHLAGVSSSKVIVAINKDPEAPFFKAADYGIVGDAFEVLPKVIAAAKALKA
ncbi:MAG: electron transfer flavoprotein subunit alpha/FixB family protein [Bacteroidetes bacterium]|nr:electron transfer flavoprotein subunit alpha/FixB family protein [Bacteroidota bacterium]